MEIKTKQINEKLLQDLNKELGLDLVSLRILINRGYDTPEKINRFVNFNKKNLRDVNTLKDVSPFMDTLISSIKNKEEITIYGDYDCDGIMATYIWVSALRRLNIKTNYFINNRFTEGYGMNIKGVDRLLSKFPNTRLIITCDNGITAKEGVEYCTAKNLKVIISDHHNENINNKILDKNIPVVCEGRLDEEKASKEYFTGAELSRRLVSELYSRLNIKNKNINYLKSLCAYSGFTIISDSVPMTPANHYIAKMGIKAMNMFKDYPIWNFLQDNNDNPIDENTIGFTFAPMFNAVSRLSGECDECIELLLTDNLEKQKELLEEMKSFNSMRKTITQDYFSAITESLENSRALIISSNAPEGILGILSGRLVEKYNKPSIVFTPVEDNPNLLKGSARSPEDVDIYSVLLECNDLLENFGGHKLACGLTIKKENLQKLKDHFEVALKNRCSNKSTKYVDFDLKTKDITYDFIEQLNFLAPYGNDFAAPDISLTFIPKKIDVMKSLHVKIEQDELKILHFSCIDKNKNPYKKDKIVKVTGHPCINYFKNEKFKQFIIDTFHNVY